jgi:hypothetical protein
LLLGFGRWMLRRMSRFKIKDLFCRRLLAAVDKNPTIQLVAYFYCGLCSSTKRKPILTLTPKILSFLVKFFLI